MFREIKELGYTGSLNLLYRYITQGRAEGGRPVITARRLARFLLNRPDKPRGAGTQLLRELTAACPEPAELDRDAVNAGLPLPHHNGRTEGVNTRTKRIMRQLHGRAGFGLLRHRFLLQ